MSPDGNGGIFSALRKTRVLQHMKHHGIQHVHVYCVDNVLVRVADPVFLGYCYSKRAECGHKVVAKRSPDEPVGILCKRRDSTVVVLEYSELEAGLGSQRDAQGRLVFRHANIANHYFTLDFLFRIQEKLDASLEYHLALKKIPYYDEASQTTRTPTAPNGYKLERFIFDVFPLAHSIAVLEVSREWEFSPLKNAPGSSTDSPETCCRDLYRCNARYLTLAGYDFADVDKRAVDPVVVVVIDLSPLVSYKGEGLSNLSGKRLRFPLVVRGSFDEVLG